MLGKPDRALNQLRNETTFPVQYLGANVPVLSSPCAATGAEPDLTVIHLCVGNHQFDIRLWRRGETKQFDVLLGDSTAVERARGRTFEQLKLGFRSWAAAPTIRWREKKRETKATLLLGG